MLHVQSGCRAGKEAVNAFRKLRVFVCCAAVKYGTVSVHPSLLLLLLVVELWAATQLVMFSCSAYSMAHTV